MGEFIFGTAVGFLAGFYCWRWQMRRDLKAGVIIFDGYRHNVEPNPSWLASMVRWWDGD